MGNPNNNIQTKKITNGELYSNDTEDMDTVVKPLVYVGKELDEKWNQVRKLLVSPLDALAGAWKRNTILSVMSGFKAIQRDTLTTARVRQVEGRLSART